MSNGWPFLGTEARAAGRVTKRTLHSRYEMVFRNVYVPKGGELTAVTRARAAWLWSGRNATIAGLSAAAVLGSKWIDADLPAELIRPQAARVDGIVVHRDTVLPGEVCLVDGMPVTTPARTAFDLGRRLKRHAAVVRLDALANATGLTPRDVDAVAALHPGARGAVALRRVLQAMDGGAESPQETRTRLLLVDAGLRRPRTQIVVRDVTGYPFARLDMGWEEWQVGVEYDGPQHWIDPSRRTRDIDRYAELDNLGWRIVRVNADLLRYRRHVVLHRVCSALAAAGCPWLVECGVDPRWRLDSVA